MSKITFECPDDILQTLSETPERFAGKGRLLIAIKGPYYMVHKAAR